MNCGEGVVALRSTLLSGSPVRFVVRDVPGDEVDSDASINRDKRQRSSSHAVERVELDGGDSAGVEFKQAFPPVVGRDRGAERTTATTERACTSPAACESEDEVELVAEVAQDISATLDARGGGITLIPVGPPCGQVLADRRLNGYRCHILQNRAGRSNLGVEAELPADIRGP